MTTSLKLQFGGRVVELFLEVADPRRIMLFRRLDARVAEQLLDGAEIDARLEQFDAECVPETMRMRVDSRHAREALDRPACAADRRRKLRVVGTRPEEILALTGDASQCCKRDGGKSDIERLMCFFHADQQTPFGIDAPALQLRGVANPHAGVEQQQYECAGTEPGPADSAAVAVVDIVTCGNEGFDLVRREGQRRHAVVFGRFDFAGRVRCEPSGIDAEFAKGAQVLDLLSQSLGTCELAAAAGGFRARVTKFAEFVDREFGYVGAFENSRK